MPSNLQWRFLDETGDGSGNTEFNVDYSGASFITPSIKDPDRDYLVSRIRLFIGDAAAGGWRSDKYSSSIGTLSRWIGLDVQAFNGLGLLKDLTAHPTPKRQRDIMSDSGYQRTFQPFAGITGWLMWTFPVWCVDSRGRPAPVLIKAGETRMGAFLNNDFSSLSVHRIAAEIQYVD